MIIAQRSRLKLIPFKSTKGIAFALLFRAFCSVHRMASNGEFAVEAKTETFGEKKHFVEHWTESLAKVHPGLPGLCSGGESLNTTWRRQPPTHIFSMLSLSPCCAARALSGRRAMWLCAIKEKKGKMRSGKMCEAVFVWVCKLIWRVPDHMTMMGLVSCLSHPPA